MQESASSTVSLKDNLVSNRPLSRGTQQQFNERFGSMNDILVSNRPLSRGTQQFDDQTKRIIFLWQMAHSALSIHPNLSHFYMNQITILLKEESRATTKQSVDLLALMQPRFCSYCSAFLITGYNFNVIHQQGTVINF